MDGLPGCFVVLLTGATLLQAFWQEQMVDLQSVVAFLQ
jgi:hypothetical protein